MQGQLDYGWLHNTSQKRSCSKKSLWPFSTQWHWTTKKYTKNSIVELLLQLKMWTEYEEPLVNVEFKRKVFCWASWFPTKMSKMPMRYWEAMLAAEVWAHWKSWTLMHSKQKLINYESTGSNWMERNFGGSVICLLSVEWALKRWFAAKIASGPCTLLEETCWLYPKPNQNKIKHRVA